MLGTVKILPGKLAHASGEAFIEPAFFDPPGVEAASILAGHAARARQCAEISAKIASSLPKCGRMEIEAVVARESAEVNVHGPGSNLQSARAVHS